MYIPELGEAAILKTTESRCMSQLYPFPASHTCEMNDRSQLIHFLMASHVDYVQFYQYLAFTTLHMKIIDISTNVSCYAFVLSLMK